jgi:ribosomal protein S4
MPASRFKTCRQISENVWQTKKLTQKQKANILKLRKKTNKKQFNFSKELQTIQKLSIFYGKLPIKKMQRSKYGREGAKIHFQALLPGTL